MNRTKTFGNRRDEQLADRRLHDVAAERAVLAVLLLDPGRIGCAMPVWTACRMAE